MSKADFRTMYSPQQVTAALASLREFHAILDAKLVRLEMADPAISVAAKERAHPKLGILVSDIYSRAQLSVIVAKDHFAAFLALSSEPVASTFTACTCIRALFESAAVATWFLDPQIDVTERVKRSFAFRYVGLMQQTKLPGIDPHIPDPEVHPKVMIDKMEEEAKKLGFAPVRSSNNPKVRTGVGMLMPSITSLVASQLDREKDYRMLSAIAHGHHWALPLLGYGLSVRDGVKAATMEPATYPSVFAYLGLAGFVSLQKPVGYFFKVNGGDSTAVDDLFKCTTTDLSKILANR